MNEYLLRYRSFIEIILRVAHLFHEVVSYADWDEVVEIVYSYIPYILSGEGARPSDIVKDIRSYMASSVPKEVLEEFSHLWRNILNGIEAICSDGGEEDVDPHAVSICRRFMDRVLRYTLSGSTHLTTNPQQCSRLGTLGRRLYCA